jgi:ribosome maturation factor RimP
MSEERFAEVIQQLNALIVPALGAEGYELVDLELKRGSRRFMLRLVIDRVGDGPYRGTAVRSEDEVLPDAVGIEDCSRVSRIVSPLLDVEDLIPVAYDLEVTSPGVNRPLRRPEHFRRAVGLEVRVKTRIPVGENKESFLIATLAEVRDDGILLDVRGRHVEIPFRVIGAANIEYKF